ncbi:MAG: DUF2336 domain-containing protein, partial [Asticcacaulis sp.]|nr:DUF2336 domain-containing protein [Asticcacaulis sp.]
MSVSASQIASDAGLPDTEGMPGSEVKPQAPFSQARHVLLKRLADVCCLPESRINAFERAVTADLLVEMLRDADVAERARVAKRLSILAELPNSLVRLLLVDEVEVARPLIEDGEALSDSDLYYCARNGRPGHRLILAGRKALPSFLSEILVDSEEMPVIETLLKNAKAEMSQQAIETIVALSQNAPQL